MFAKIWKRTLYYGVNFLDKIFNPEPLSIEKAREVSALFSGINDIESKIFDILDSSRDEDGIIKITEHKFWELIKHNNNIEISKSLKKLEKEGILIIDNDNKDYYWSVYSLSDLGYKKMNHYKRGIDRLMFNDPGRK